MFFIISKDLVVFNLYHLVTHQCMTIIYIYNVKYSVKNAKHVTLQNAFSFLFLKLNICRKSA